MSRIIKYRGKLLKRAGDKVKGEWVYGLPQQRVEIGGVPNPNKPPEIGYIVTWEPERGLQSGAPDNDLYWYEIDPQTLGQFTGKLDKQEKEIYEGDVVVTHNEQEEEWPVEEQFSGVVAFQGTMFVIQQLHDTYTPSLSNTAIRSIEVVNNIYEAPALGV